MSQRMSLAMKRLQQCPFCLQGIGMGQSVCLSCGAQHRTVKNESMLGHLTIRILVFGICLAALPLSLYGGGVAVYLPVLLGFPEWLSVTVGFCGVIGTLVGLPWMSWKGLNRMVENTAKFYLVWSRGGDQISTAYDE